MEAVVGETIGFVSPHSEAHGENSIANEAEEEVVPAGDTETRIYREDEVDEEEIALQREIVHSLLSHITVAGY